MKSVLIQLSNREVYTILRDNTVRPNWVRGQELLTSTGAKLYPKGGAWFLISGYSHDGKDVDDLVRMLQREGERCKDVSLGRSLKV